MNLFATMFLTASLILAGTGGAHEPPAPAAPAVSVKCPCHAPIAVDPDHDIATSWDPRARITIDGETGRVTRLRIPRSGVADPFPCFDA